MQPSTISKFTRLTVRLIHHPLFLDSRSLCVQTLSRFLAPPTHQPQPRLLSSSSPSSLVLPPRLPPLCHCAEVRMDLSCRLSGCWCVGLTRLWKCLIVKAPCCPPMVSYSSWGVARNVLWSVFLRPLVRFHLLTAAAKLFLKHYFSSLVIGFDI